MGKHVVARVAEFPPGTRRIVQLDGFSVGVMNIKGTYYALRNSCPHQGGPLCLGTVGGFVTSSGPGEYRFERPGEMLRCPWHQWEYDITTGQSWFDPARVRTRKYSVRVSSGAELIVEDDVEAGPEEGDERLDGPTGLQPGPFVAETYPVSVDRDYVIVDQRR
jgi:3-phenylpropionate/trans-cinnamate dioxygenase ferredoxin subunit